MLKLAKKGRTGQNFKCCQFLACIHQYNCKFKGRRSCEYRKCFQLSLTRSLNCPKFYFTDRGSIALSLRWVSVKRGVGIVASAGVGFYLFSKECCFRVRVTVSVKPNPNLNPKTVFLKKKPDPGPGPAPRFTDTPKLMVAAILT